MNRGQALLWMALVAAQAAVCPSLLGEERAGAPRRPKYQNIRHDEDWSALADQDAAAQGDFLDPIKYIPLSPDGFVWAGFGGQIRERAEAWNDFAFGGPGERDAVFLLSRFRLYGDLHVGPHFRVFVEGKSAHATDRELPGGRRPLDVDVLELQNGFVELNLFPSEVTSLTFRAGRQELSFGKQRLVSPLDWANTRRAFDALTGIFRHEDWTVTGFWSHLVPTDKYHFNDYADNTRLAGVHVTRAWRRAGLTTDFYYLDLRQKPATFNGTTGTERRKTVGARVGGPIADTSFDFDLEGAWQFGDVGPGDIDAFMFASQVGYTLAAAPASPRFFIGFDYASGDHRAGGDVETFNQLFPLAHAYHGYIDMVARQNVMDLNAGVACKPTQKLALELKGHHFWRADNDDALYNAGAGVARPGAAGSSTDVGTEVDLMLKYAIDSHQSAIFGYSHFFPGHFVEQSGPHKDIDFAYLVWLFTF